MPHILIINYKLESM